MGQQDPKPPKRIKFTVNMPVALYDSLRARFRETYPEHGLSFNAWVIKRLEAFEALVYNK